MRDYLSAAEVEALPVGTRVQIVWCGGNGPHHYTMGRNGWGEVTTVTDEPVSTEAVLRLDQVGPERHHHRITLDE
jgi:hypothetical protein